MIHTYYAHAKIEVLRSKQAPKLAVLVMES